MKYKKGIRKCLTIVCMIALIFASVPVALFAADNDVEFKDNPDRWMMLDSYYNKDNKEFVLTEKKTWQRGSMWYDTPYYSDFQIELDYYTGDVQSYWGADGITVAFYADFDYKMINGQDMAFCGSNGYGIELDTFQNLDYEDPEYNHIALVKDIGKNHIAIDKLPESEDGKWHHLEIDVNAGVCKAYVDNQLKISSEVSSTGNGWIGITSATGNGVNEHKVRNVKITGEKGGEAQEQLMGIDLTSNVNRSETSCDIEITAKITNGMGIKGRNSFAGLILQDGLTFKDSEKDVIALGDIDVGGTAEAKWTVTCNLEEAPRKYDYKVLLIVDDIAKMEKNDYVWVPGTATIDNSIIMGKDQWSFSNNEKYFSNPRDKGYYISQKDYDKLTYKLSNAEKFKIFYEANKNWGGSCFGLATSIILTKMGVIAPQELAGVKTLYKVRRKDQTDDEIESLINFYQLQQYTSAYREMEAEFEEKNNNLNSLQKLDQMASDVKNGGVPVLLAYRWHKLDDSGEKVRDENGDYEYGGHAVVAYDAQSPKNAQSNGYSGGGLEKSYDRRIVICDPNYPQGNNDREYLYYDTKTGEWEIPARGMRSFDKSEAWISFATNKLEDIDIVNYISAERDYNGYLEASKGTKFTLKKNGASYSVDGLQDVDGLTIISGAVGYLDGKDSPVSTIIQLSNADDVYEIEPANRHTEVDYSWQFNDCMANITSSNAAKIICNQEGEIAFEGNDSDFTMDLVFNEGSYSLPWYATSVSGKHCDNAKLEQTSEGILITGDNLKDIEVSTMGDSGTKALEFSTDKSAALITKEDNTSNRPCIKVDADNDGTYETKINAEKNQSIFPTIQRCIKSTVSTGGNLTPAGKVMILNGSSRTFTITPDPGYEIADVLVDGKSVGAVSSYTFKNVTADHTISATFKKKEGNANADADALAQKIKAAKAVKLKSSSTQGKDKSGKRYIKVKWTKQGAAVTGYQVYRSDKKKSGFKEFYTTKKKYYYNTRSLKKGNRYYYKVRAYTIIDGKKYYSKWSNMAYRTVKK